MQKIMHYLGVLAALVAGFLGNLPAVVQVLLVVMVLDIVTGFIRAAMLKQVSSAEAWKGVFKKVTTLMIIFMVSYIQKISAMTSLPATEIAAGFYLYYEGLSVLENAAAIGVPIPQWLRDALAAFNPEKAGRRATDKV